MNIPIEVVELIVNHFLAVSDQDQSYIKSLNTISLVNSYFHERSRYIRYKKLTIKGDTVTIKLGESHFSIDSQLLRFRKSITRTSPFVFSIARYAKDLTVQRDKESFCSFEKLFGKENLTLDSLAFAGEESRRFKSTRHRIDLSGIVRIDIFEVRTLSDVITFEALSSSRTLLSCVVVNCYDVDELEAMIPVLNRLPHAIKLSVYCGIVEDTPQFTHPIHTLHVLVGHIATLDCFSALSSTIVDLSLFFNDNFNCDSFVSSCNNLKKLSVHRTSFNHTSLLASLQVVSEHKTLRRASFRHFGYDHEEDEAEYSLRFLFNTQTRKLECFGIMLNIAGGPLDKSYALTMLIMQMIDKATFKPKMEFINTIFQTDGEVKVFLTLGDRLVAESAAPKLVCCSFDILIKVRDFYEPHGRHL